MVELEDEQECIAASRQGDHQAFELLVRRYQRMIHSLTFRMTGSMSDAEDLAQETFLQAFHKLDSFRGESKFSSWLCQIAVNQSLNWRKKTARRHRLQQEWAAENQDHSVKEPPAGDADLSRLIQESLLKLPAKQRAAIVLTAFEGLNHAEAARALGCSETTVSWRIFTARNKLRKWLGPNLNKS
jgi:RNA polymerase sigma-70 factor, ECF subfamily